MIDIKFLRENPDIVKENIKKKFQNHKLILVDEVIELDKKSRELIVKGDELRSQRNSLSKEIGNLMREGKKEEAEEIKNLIEEELSNEIIDGNIIVRHLSTIVVDIKAKRILKDAGTNKGIERAIICSDIPTIDENAFDENTNIIDITSKPKTKKR